MTAVPISLLTCSPVPLRPDTQVVLCDYGGAMRMNRGNEGEFCCNPGIGERTIAPQQRLFCQQFREAADHDEPPATHPRSIRERRVTSLRAGGGSARARTRPPAS